MLISSGDRTRCYPDISLKHGIGGAAFRHTFPDATLRTQLVEGWNIFPNPSDGEVYEYLKSEKDEAYSLTFYDISGKETVKFARQASNRKYSIVTEQMARGLYFAQVKTQNGKIYTHKLLLK